MTNMTIATVFVVALNVLMFLCQVAMTTLNPSGAVCYHTEGTVIGNTMQTQAGLLNGSVAETDALDDLPGSQGTVTIGDAIGFTDIFNNILGWFKTAPGIRYVYGVISAPYHILQCIGLPAQFIVGVGTFWYMVSLLVLVAFLWGRE